MFQVKKLPALTPEFRSMVIERIEPGDSCWRWKGSHQNNGYPSIRYKGRLYVATRIVFKIFRGKSVPMNKFACHHCDNPWCVNPYHLFIGSPADNNFDRVAKQRRRRGLPIKDIRKRNKNKWAGLFPEEAL